VWGWHSPGSAPAQRISWKEIGILTKLESSSTWIASARQSCPRMATRKHVSLMRCQATCLVQLPRVYRGTQAGAALVAPRRSSQQFQIECCLCPMGHLKHHALPQLPGRCRERQVLMLPNAPTVSEICQCPCSAEMACSGEGNASPGLACTQSGRLKATCWGKPRREVPSEPWTQIIPIHLPLWILQ
jgi:hypothetical protein